MVQQDYYFSDFDPFDVSMEILHKFSQDITEIIAQGVDGGLKPDIAYTTVTHDNILYIHITVHKMMVDDKILCTIMESGHSDQYDFLKYGYKTGRTMGKITSIARNRVLLKDQSTESPLVV